MKSMVIGVAGHVAHGKTSLVTELTGTSTDSSRPEKERGVSMDIGLSHLPLSDRSVLDFVDFPGHERFIRSMIRGASGVDAAILVVAANAGIMPQTEEHLEVLKLFGVEIGLCVVSKIDLVDESTEARVKGELARFFKNTFMDGAPIVGFSAETGEGRERIITWLRELVDGRVIDRESKIFRLPVDKVYSASGRGIIVAGTVIGGGLTRGEDVAVYPAGVNAKARSLQVHREARSGIRPHERAGLNLAGVKGRLVRRGDTVARPGTLIPSKTVNARLELSPLADTAIVDRARARISVGTDEVIGQIVFLCGNSLGPGEESFVQFRCDNALSVLPGDRFIIRPPDGGRVLGGGMILQNAASRRGMFEETLLDRLERLAKGSEIEVVADALWSLGHRLSRADELVPLSGLVPERIGELLSTLVAGKRARCIVDAYIAEDRFEELCRIAERSLRLECEKAPLRRRFKVAEVKSKIPSEVDRALFLSLLAHLESIGLIEVVGDQAIVIGIGVELSPSQQGIIEAVRSLCRDSRAPVRAGTLREMCGEDAAIEPVLQYLAEQDEIVLFKDSSFLSPRAFAELLETLRGAMGNGQTLMLGEIRDLLEIGRNPLQVILEHLDDSGFTRREGGGRVLSEGATATAR